MLERRRRWERRYRLNLWISDAAIIIACCVFATVLRLQMLDPNLIAEDPGIIARIPLITSVGWLVALSAFGTRESELFGSGVTEYTRVAQATGFAFGLLAIAFIVFQWPGLRTQLLVSLPIGLLVLLASRWLWRRWLLRRRRFGEYVSRAFVVGAHDEVAFVLRRLGTTWALGYQVVGASLSDRPVSSIAVDGHAYPVVGSVYDAAATAHRLGADAIIVASQPDEDPDFVQRLSQQMVGTAAELVIGGRLADVAGPRISLRPLEGLPLIQVKIPTFEGGAHVVKRAFDLVVSSLALLVTLPIALVVAIIIKLGDGGPVFYRQKRVGRDGREFDMLKFRSMRVGADAERALLLAQNEGSGPLFKMRNDPRVTHVGRILRKHSLDELPQFWNVFIGDMSVVGPRPPLPSEVTTYDGRVYRRLYIKPGITGPWQVGGRSNLSWDESVRLDLHYVENWSVLDDLRIMWRTVGVMLKPEGAY